MPAMCVEMLRYHSLWHDMINLNCAVPPISCSTSRRRYWNLNIDTGVFSVIDWQSSILFDHHHKVEIQGMCLFEIQIEQMGCFNPRLVAKPLI